MNVCDLIYNDGLDFVLLSSLLSVKWHSSFHLHSYLSRCGLVSALELRQAHCHPLPRLTHVQHTTINTMCIEDYEFYK